MKVLITLNKSILLVIGMLLLTTNVFASNINSTIKIINAKRKVFALNIENIRVKDYKVQISDASKNLLLEDEISAKKRFSKVYDLSKLPEGKYEVKIEGDLYIRKQFVMLTTNILEVIGEEEVKIFKPSLKLKENRIALNMLSPKGMPVTVSILSSSGVTIFSEKIENSLAIHKYYDMSKLPSGEYTMKVNTQETSFYQDIDFKKEILASIK